MIHGGHESPGNGRRRCRAWPFATAAVLSLSIAAPVRGGWPDGTTVSETFHNLTHPAAIDPMSGMIANYRETCVYCHAPHATAGERPLWNRRMPTGPYRMYEGPLDMIADPQPTGVSRNCLSCHDGTIGLDDVTVPPARFTGRGPFRETMERCASCHSGGSPAADLNFKPYWFRPDELRLQHPISIVYDPSRDPGFQPASSVAAAGLVLENGRVQCGTCHEPHTARYRPFLRIPNSNGSLCLVCHRTPPARTTAHFW